MTSVRTTTTTAATIVQKLISNTINETIPKSIPLSTTSKFFTNGASRNGTKQEAKLESQTTTRYDNERNSNSHQRRAYHLSLHDPRPPFPPLASSKPPILRDIQPVTPIDYDSDILSPLKRQYAIQRPLVIRDAAFFESPDVKLWKDTAYLETVVGSETPCDVEIGGQFDKGEMVTSRIQFGDYISYLKMAIDMAADGKENDDDDGGYSALETQNVVYLAQNEIFDGMHQDFTAPRFCTDGSIGRGDLYATKIWIGPYGTVSPLHYDPLDNILLQCVGEKVVTLYPPSITPKTTTADATMGQYKLDEDSSQLPPSLSKEEDVDYYYAGKGPSGQMNVSSVDIERPDFKKYPKFRLAPQGAYVRLREGDMLFIPKRWWHHVRGDSAWSLSLNCWWN